MDLGCLSRPLKKALTAKPTCSHSSIGTCRRSMSSGCGDGGSSWPMIIRRTSLHKYLHCAGRAAMSSFRMAAVSRLLLKRQTLISRRTPEHWLRYQSRCIGGVANTHQRARDGHGVPQGSGGAGICCAAAERNQKREAKGACFQQRGPRRIARVGTAKGSRDGLGAKSETHVAR